MPRINFVWQQKTQPLFAFKMFWNRRLTQEEKDEQARQDLLRLLTRPELRAALNQAMANAQAPNPAPGAPSAPPPMPPPAAAAAPAAAVAGGDGDTSFVDSISNVFRGVAGASATPTSPAPAAAPAAAPAPANPGLVPTVSQDPSAFGGGLETSSGSPNAHAKAHRRHGGGKYIWDARVQYSLGRKGKQLTTAVPMEGHIVTRISSAAGGGDPLLMFHFIHARNKTSMELFLSFLNSSIQDGEALTIDRLSEIFEQFIITLWMYHGWDEQGVPMPKFYRDDDDDDWSPGGKRRASGSPRHGSPRQRIGHA